MYVHLRAKFCSINSKLLDRQLCQCAATLFLSLIWGVMIMPNILEKRFSKFHLKKRIGMGINSRDNKKNDFNMRSGKTFLPRVFWRSWKKGVKQKGLFANQKLILAFALQSLVRVFLNQDTLLGQFGLWVGGSKTATAGWGLLFGLRWDIFVLLHPFV